MNLMVKQIVTDEVMDDDITSEAVPVYNAYGFYVQAIVTGTPTGSIKLQASGCDPKYVQGPQPQVPPEDSWNDIDDSEVSLSSAGITSWNYNGAYFTFLRVAYEDGSSGASTAVLNVRVTVKGV